MWGVAMLIDAVVRVVLAYTLPVHVVPAMQRGMIIVTVLVMQVLNRVEEYYSSGPTPWRLAAALQKISLIDRESLEAATGSISVKERFRPLALLRGLLECPQPLLMLHLQPCAAH